MFHLFWNQYCLFLTSLVYDILHETEKDKIPGLLMLIDFEKAFDSVSWSFLYRTLKLFNFQESFIRWIRTFNTNVKAYVIQSGFLSASINIERGCRQGDPIAPYLFILCAQILCYMIIQNKKIRGINFNNTEIKISQYADDTTLILCGETGPSPTPPNLPNRSVNHSQRVGGGAVRCACSPPTPRPETQPATGEETLSTDGFLCVSPSLLYFYISTLTSTLTVISSFSRYNINHI